MNTYGIVINGEIKRTFTLEGESPEPDAVLLPEGATSYTHYVFNGQCLQIPMQPNQYTRFNHATGEWQFDSELAWALVRQRRDSLLTACDWRALSDVGQSSAWLDYRQALRDITKQPDPSNIIWPPLPE